MLDGTRLILSSLVFSCFSFGGAFLSTPSILSRTPQNKMRPLFYSQFDEDILNQRLQDMRRMTLEKELMRPPNPSLGPTDFVNAVLESLLDPDDPLPDSGLRLLLRASTPSWQAQLRQSIGASSKVEEDVAASALGSALSRPGNQFGILVGTEDRYVANFPTDALDFHDGTCWVECQLRSVEGDKLLVIMGWQLEQGRDGAWLIDGLDWQDFRDSYRPGIGREEWMRICG
jgi:hypothetical protein